MTDPIINRVIRQLTARGDQLEARAIRALQNLYGDLDLGELIELLRIATELDSPLARAGYMDEIMELFDQAALSLAQPPAALGEAVRSAVQSGVTGTAEMFAASQLVTDAFNVPATLQLQWMETAEERMLKFWGAEPSRFRGEVQRAIYDGLARGQGIDQVRARLEERAGVSRARATLIARNEIGSASAYAMQESQKEAGLTHYIWRTASDNRVRPEHVKRNGKTFAWDDPPPDGHPGDPIQCRCVALAVIPK